MTDGPIYRAISNPNAVLVHTHIEDLDRAMQWFQTDAFEEASARSTAIRRDFYLADSQHPT
jgi:heme-degrading monooxygenase HmoA